MGKLTSADNQPKAILVTGPTGAGKTDFMNTILGEIQQYLVHSFKVVKVAIHFLSFFYESSQNFHKRRASKIS